MKIGDQKPVGGKAGLRAEPRRDGLAAEAGSQVGAGRTVTDTTSIMGIPEAELTPKVRDAIMSLMAEVDGLRQELTQVRDRLRETEALADRDPLLPVLNRRAFVRELSRVISLAKRYGEASSLIYFDLDHFKQVNDAFGHAGGDAVLQRLAGTLLDNVRETDIVGRLGGDEFGIILSHADEAAARVKAEMLTGLMRKLLVPFEGQEIGVSLSAGTISFKPDEDPAEALARADRAMFEAKRARAKSG